MPKTSAQPTKTPPASFGQYNREQYQRVVQLTEKAIAKLESAHQPVTLTALAEMTRSLDSEEKGISSRTLLRNVDAAALFRQHSSAYQARQQKAKKAKRKRAKAKTNADVRATYRGLHSSDLIRMVEDLKTKIVEMKAQQARLQAERDEAYRLRDEALQHNARQLAALTAMTKAQAPNKKR